MYKSGHYSDVTSKCDNSGLLQSSSWRRGSSGRPKGCELIRAELVIGKPKSGDEWTRPKQLGHHLYIAPHECCFVAVVAIGDLGDHCQKV